jgi:WD40 repeat protein
VHLHSGGNRYTQRHINLVRGATGGKGGVARAWTVREGESVREIEAHRAPVNAVAWVCPPDEIPWLVTGSDDATVRVWNLDTGRSHRRAGSRTAPSRHRVWSVAATVLADGHVCVVAGANDSMTTLVFVWDVTTGETLHRFMVEQDDASLRVPQVAVVTLVDRSFRVAVSAGPVVRVWDGLTGDVVRTLSLPDARDSAVAMAVPDLRVAVAATDGGRTVVWDAESGLELTAVTTGRGNYPPAVDQAVSPTGDSCCRWNVRATHRPGCCDSTSWRTTTDADRRADRTRAGLGAT